MDEIVRCKNCGEKELYDYMTWRDGKQYCRTCINIIWEKERAQNLNPTRKEKNDENL